ncbi:hypothetical protein PAQ31011_03142 [Pandoraea aquatica]|uniref:MFS transporter n=1 Tax=Pandoraea aquatica TaxID=2508290 RepID=A0A5E4WCM3_9BURK|nr:MFS transporter [Pandoraea aquatica]VVE20805.1 hypothetical protein PAQ31011_03142 [Pandoraea aquatica]
MSLSLIAFVRDEPLFARVLLADLISKTGDGAHELAFVLLALAVTNGDLHSVGWIYFLRFLPYLIAGPLGGRLADTRDARRVMLFCDTARGGVTVALAVAVGLNALTPWGLAAAGCVMTTFRTLFQPAFQASVPRLVDAERLVFANGMTQISIEVGGAIGPALAGVLLWAGSLTWVIAFDALTYGVAWWILMSIRPEARGAFVPAPESAGTADQPTSHWVARVQRAWVMWWQACREIGVSPPLFSAIVMSSICILFVGAALRVMIPAWALEVGGSESTAALVASLIAGGTIAGASVFARRVRRLSAVRLLCYWAIYGGILALLPLHQGVFWLLSVAVVMGVAGACVDIVLASLIQRHSRASSVGTNFSVFSTLANTGEALSAVLAGVLVGMCGLSGGLMCSGLLVVAASVLGVWLVARRTGAHCEVVDAK